MNKLLKCPGCGRDGFDSRLSRCLCCGDAVPRVLTERNPDNAHHVVAALQLLQRLNGITVTERTVAEVRALGLPIPKRVRKIAKVDIDSIAIGMPYLLQRGLLLPDNIIMTCQACRGAIQYTPHMAHAQATHLCIFCALDRSLADFWQSARHRQDDDG